MTNKVATVFTYNILWQKIAMETEYSKSGFFKALGISTQTLDSMLHGYGINLKTIDTICSYFKCQPDEIMELRVSDSESQSDNQK